jgi:hypothetical protein
LARVKDFGLPIKMKFKISLMFRKCLKNTPLKPPILLHHIFLI